MKRSSSKLISKASSMRNVNKQGFKFKFDLHVESADKLTTSSEICVTWERGTKILATNPTRIDKHSRVAHFGGQTLSQEVTLFKKKRDNAVFEPKVYKINVRQANERGKVLGKIDLNFADYVEIPTFSKRLGATMSSGGQLILRVASTYLGEAKPPRKSRGSSSIGSSQFDYDSDAQSLAGFDNQSEADTNLDDLDDLDVHGPISVPPPQPSPKKTLIRTRPQIPTSNSMAEAPVTQRRFQRKASLTSETVQKRDPSPSRDLASKWQSMRRAEVVDVGATNGTGPSREEFERLRRENRGFQRKNDDLQSRVNDLETQVEYSNANGTSDTVEDLKVENESLKKKLEDVTTKLMREPVYSDVVRELREAKMALAIISLEKDELMQQLRLAKR